MKKKITLAFLIGVGFATMPMFAQVQGNISQQAEVQLMQGIGPVVSGSVNYDQLPVKAQKFLSENYKDTPVKFIEKEFGDNIYEVCLQNGTEIEFTSTGNLHEIDGNGKSIPASVVKAVIPENVLKSISKQTNCDDIEKIEVNFNGQYYDIEFVKTQKLQIKEMKVDASGRVFKTKKF